MNGYVAVRVFTRATHRQACRWRSRPGRRSRTRRGAPPRHGACHPPTGPCTRRLTRWGHGGGEGGIGGEEMRDTDGAGERGRQAGEAGRRERQADNAPEAWGWGDLGRFGEIWGDLGRRAPEAYSQVPSPEGKPSTNCPEYSSAASPAPGRVASSATRAVVGASSPEAPSLCSGGGGGGPPVRVNDKSTKPVGSLTEPAGSLTKPVGSSAL